MLDFSDDKDRAISFKATSDCFLRVLFRSVANIDPAANEIWISFLSVVPTAFLGKLSACSLLVVPRFGNQRAFSRLGVAT